MWRTLSRALVLAAIGAAVACAGESDRDPGQAAYTEALAYAYSHRPDSQFSEKENECLAAAYVGVAGSELLNDHVTPDEIRDDPEKLLSEWGVEITEDQAQEIYEAMKPCANLGANYVDGVITSFDGLVPSEDRPCLEESLDEGLLEELSVNGIIGEESMPDDLANSTYDWIDGCVGLRDAVVGAVSQEVGPDVATCVDAQLTDEVLRDSAVGNMTTRGGLDDDPFTDILESCAQQAGEIDS